MPRNKPRLQLALYARPKHPDTYHYALFVSPKRSRQQARTELAATKQHVKNTLLQHGSGGEIAQPWRYERLAVPDFRLEQRLLVRIVIAKVMTSATALETILEAVPVYQVGDTDQADGALFTCLTWVRAALEELRARGAVAGLGEWEGIQNKVLEYVKRKREEGR